ncbi:nad(p)h-quinone oxidoreductase subunit j, partial [Quercus suber]
QPEEVCIKVFAPRWNPRIPSVFWVWKSADFQERESYDMLGIFYDNHPRIYQLEEVCIKVFAPRWNPRIPSVFWGWKSVDFQERESYDMLGIFYDNHPRICSYNLTKEGAIFIVTVLAVKIRSACLGLNLGTSP